MKKKLFIVILIIIVLLALYYKKILDTSFGIKIGNTYQVNFDINVNNEPMFNDADYPEFSLNKNALVKVIDIENDFAKIDYKGNKGWISAWYISKKSAKIKDIDPYIRVIDKEASIYLLPEKNNEYSRFKKGKVIKIIATYSDWYCVEYIRYDCPTYDSVWIKKEDTKEYDISLVKEGYLREVKTYTEDGILTNETITGYVFIRKEKNDLYRVQGIGGESVYIKEIDFTPITSNDVFPSYSLD
ncbi:MAG: hypothetical protein MJA31_16580 [Clostridia bacterium]|nr:hypothetical protein [Clostridia bacterium]